jgi:DNA helicase II / ATP-dependent DNA helicase PcrA
VSLDPLFHISTIHSFAWHLIGGFNSDIRAWLRVHVSADIREIEEAERKGRSGTQASIARQAAIVAKTERLAILDQIKSFIYNPNGDNRETNSCLGFFGDTMQRIYGDGKERFEEAIPGRWEKPRKQLNHRCPKRVVKLINQIRRDVDDQVQVARTDNIEGCVRLFILPSETVDKPAVEDTIRLKMAEITNDRDWGVRKACKILILEHHMAARRMGFQRVFDPLYEVNDFRTGLLDGTLPALRFFSESVLALVEASRKADKFRVAKIVRDRSPLLSVAGLEASKSAQAQLQLAREAVGDLMSLWQSGAPTCGDVLKHVASTGLFVIPDALKPFLSIPEDGLPSGQVEPSGDIDMGSKPLSALSKFLEAPFLQIEHYVSYLDEDSSFDTHQGVKGLEFDRVMVVMDDTDARGFLFSYDKLFGAEARSAADLKRQSEGQETSLDRTRRLFYVTCSRAKSSLALVAYTGNQSALRSHVLRNGWFEEHELAS